MIRRIATALKKPVFNIIDRFTFRENKFLDFFAQTQSWTVGELRAYQLKKLRELSMAWGLGVRTWEDFYRLPLTAKADIEGWQPRGRTKYHTHETSGSTGTPRIVYVPWETWYRKDALFHRSWEWLGRQPYQPVLRLVAGTPRYSWYDWWRNDRVMRRDITREHVDWVVRHRPYLIHGPGGPIRILCEEIIKAGHGDVLKGIRIEWCSLSPEGHKERLAPLVRSFHEQYGLAELPTVGSPCLYSTHVVMETGIVEIIDGEIVVTDFNNHIMPVIRYRTGDEGQIRESDCPCGRQHPILYNVKGRRTDYYDGPEVKKPISWWVVSPISHQYLNVVSAWKLWVFPRRGECYLHVVLVDGAEPETLEPYSRWVEEETGLRCIIVAWHTAEASRSWKRDLVRVFV